MPNVHPIIILLKDKERSLQRFHPWIFSGAIQKLPPNIQPGDIVDVYSSKNTWLATGFYEGGSIAIKVLSFENTPIDHHFWKSKLLKAFELRQKLGLIDDSKTNTYRLVHGEGDFLPGLIIDIYGHAAVIQSHSNGVSKSMPEIVSALKDLYQSALTVICEKQTSHKQEGRAGYHFHLGDATEPVWVRENDVEFAVDLKDGQKTGFFIDQRENRLLLNDFVKNKSVLNTFCYTGGFSCYALNAGAKKVTSIDSSEPALKILEMNVSKTHKEKDHSTLKLDVFDYFKTSEEKWDVVILDPPAFAKHLSARHQAIQAYKRLNLAGIKNLNPGGILFTFSCSQVVTPDLFEGAISAAAIESGKRIRILHRLFQSSDHPWNIYHPEGLYLKGLVLHVE